jgi:hypothetical protein
MPTEAETNSYVVAKPETDPPLLLFVLVDDVEGN